MLKTLWDAQDRQPSPHATMSHAPGHSAVKLGSLQSRPPPLVFPREVGSPPTAPTPQGTTPVTVCSKTKSVHRPAESMNFKGATAQQLPSLGTMGVFSSSSSLHLHKMGGRAWLCAAGARAALERVWETPRGAGMSDSACGWEGAGQPHGSGNLALN
jgi:hypothetical protein